MLERPQVQRLVVRGEGAGTPAQFGLQLMGNATGMQIALQRSSAPLRGLGAQFLVGQGFCLGHGADGDEGPGLRRARMPVLLQA